MEKTKAKKTATQNKPRVMRGEFVGVVVSDKMQKTISVEVFRLIRHAKYGKFQKTSTVFKAHDEKGEAKAGDTVRIFQCRPYSKTKRWALVEVLEKKKQVEGVEI